MSVGQSGTSGFPIGSEYWKQLNLEKFEPKEIEVFPQKKIPKKPMMDHMEVNPQFEKIETYLEKPVKDNLDRLPESMRQKFTPEMKADIERGMTNGEFFVKYSDELGICNCNHGI